MRKLQLMDREWKEFSFSTIFIFIQRGKRLTKENQTDGLSPYVSSSALNNGVDNFISNNDNIRKFKNCLTLANSGSVGATFYQAFEFIASDHVTALGLEEPNKYVYIFLSTLIKRIQDKYSFNREINDKRIRREKIMLPINSENEPDWQFMEDYIKQIEQEKVQQLIAYYQSKILETQLSANIKLPQPQWASFKISEFFNFMRGNQNNMAQCEKGEIPLISARKMENGYKDFITNNGKKLFPKDIITLNNDGDGGVGLAYFQPTITALDTHVTALLPKIDLTKNMMLYISLMISIQREKFSHGYSINNERLTAQQIMLPIDEQGKPNWQFMEDFIKNIEKNKINTLLHYLNEYHQQPTANSQQPTANSQQPTNSMEILQDKSSVFYQIGHAINKTRHEKRQYPIYRSDRIQQWDYRLCG